MRVLLDHNLPHKLRTNLGTPGKHEFVTASYMRWGDLKNGELLRAAEERGIEAFVTGDRSFVYEQNLTGRRLAIVALSTNNLSALRPGSRCKGLSLTASPFEIAAGHGTA